MKVNFEKTKFMFFHKEKDATVGEVRHCIVNGNIIQRVFVFTYLSVLLDPHLNFNLHFEYVSSKVSGRLKYIIGVKRHMSCQAMCHMVNAYVHSVTDYFCIQNKINRFLINYFFPTNVKKGSRKKTYTSIRNSIDANSNARLCLRLGAKMILCHNSLSLVI
jgi:hypothetical protein